MASVGMLWWWAKMVLARMSFWKFKPGLLEQGFALLDDTLAEAARRTKGFRGNLTLLSKDAPDTGVVITLWATDDALKASYEEVFQKAAQKIQQFVTGPPEVKNYRVFSAELRH